MHSARRLAAIAALALLAAASAADAAERTSADGPAIHGEFLVSFADGASAKEREKAVKDHGGRIFDAVEGAGVFAAEFPETKAKKSKDADKAKARELKKDKRFSLIEPNFVYTASYTPNDPSLGSQWAWSKIRAFTAWDTAQGSSSTVIAVIDTGVQRTHPDLDGKIVAGYDYVQGDTAPDDGHGHGTHVAGSAAAETNNATGGAGMCPGCRVMPVRVLDNSGNGSLVNVANGIRWAADNGAKVVNLSLGGPGSSTLQSAVDYATSRGVFLACAAGNSNTSSTSSAYPAAYANCFAIASTTSTDARSSFSNYGSWVEVAAPGSSIYSTWIGSGYNTISGTSMATPHVAGLAGLLASQGLTAAQAKDRICSTSVKISGTGSFWTCGRIDAASAVAGGTTPPPPPPPPPGTEQIVNGGFESGTSPWAQTSTNGYQLIDPTRPHAGAYSAWLGGYNSGTDTIGQAVTIPSNGTLTYWWYMTTQESGSTVWDTFRVRLYDASTGSLVATLRTWSNASGAGLWRQDTLSLGAYAGRRLTVRFEATTDYSLPSSFFVDDVSVR